MYAIIADGGRQYRVEKGTEFKLDRLGQEQGGKIVLDDVLLVADGDNVKVGAPKVAGASVEVEVLEEIKDKKLIAFTYRRRKANSKRKRGHRQRHTLVKVTNIKA
ncbi:MAG: 50S ribosomal protein L21 [Planctomycetes bacterium]|nr:50S ribosomal protein L21 [Planctomycetota bacterium]MCA8934682.1 50S ribosomal protein L21 [Planctomycetota bacterium]MCA8945451.1 50S ribosomal protein L21 [Planctomycetota bacterium]